MQATDKHKFKQNSPEAAGFPRGHIVIAGALAVGLSFWALTPSDTPEPLLEEKALPALEHNLDAGEQVSGPANVLAAPNGSVAQHTSGEQLSAQSFDAEPLTSGTSATSDITTAETKVDTSSNASIEPEPLIFTVKSGDSLSTLFKRAGLSDRDVYQLTHTCAEAKSLTRIMPGHQIHFYLSEDGQLTRLSHVTDRLNSLHFERTIEGGYVSAREIKQPELRSAYKEATISSSMYLAATDVGMPDSLIMELANVFGWDIDFALDLRKGDKFSVVFEEKFLDGEKIGHGAILAAEFINQGDKFRAVRYTHANGDSHYYTPTGDSMRKAFLLAPLDFRRISGNFNPKRLHPIFKTVRPHRGTDYAANRGTPVWASGDGKVTAAGYTKANGNYVFIQHGNNVVTKYLHLHKRHVRTGQRVKQKQTIGTVGSTGYATGPHLHYEFLLDGVHRNPRTIVQKLPKAKSIGKDEMQDFLAQTQPLMASLDERHNAAQLAMGTTDRTIN